MKPWQAPKLIVLTRTHPEEAVLTACKNPGIMGNPSDFYQGCGISDGVGPCSDCEAQAQS